MIYMINKPHHHIKGWVGFFFWNFEKYLPISCEKTYWQGKFFSKKGGGKMFLTKFEKYPSLLEGWVVVKEINFRL